MPASLRALTLALAVLVLFLGQPWPNTAHAAGGGTGGPLVSAEASQVQVRKGDEITFAIKATFLDGDGAFYEIDVDEQELPDGYAVVDTGDSQRLSTASAGDDAKASQDAGKVIGKYRYYKLKATEPGVWVLPKARLIPSAGTAADVPSLETSPIYTVIAKAGAAPKPPPFFRLLPAKAAVTQDGKPMSYFQISSLAPQTTLDFGRIAMTIFAGSALLLLVYGLAFYWRRKPASAPKPSPVTIAALHEDLEQAAYRDRYPAEIKEGFDTVHSVLLRYAAQFLGKDFSPLGPEDLPNAVGFFSAEQQQHFSQAWRWCYEQRFKEPGKDARDTLAKTVASAMAAVMEPPREEAEEVAS